jgi:hypothetical protein
MATTDYQGFKTTFPTGDPKTDFSDGIDDITLNYMFAQKFTLGAGTWDINKIGAFGSGSNVAGDAARYAIYTDSSGPSALVANSLTSEVVFTRDTTNGAWLSHTYSTKPQLTAGDYWLVIWSNKQGTFCISLWTKVVTAKSQKATCTYAATGDPGTIGSWAAQNRDWPIAVECQAAAPPLAAGTLDIFLRPGHATPEDITLRDPTLADGAGGAHSLACEAGTFSLVGQDVALKAQRKVDTSVGAFTLSGQDVALKHGYTLAAAAGSYALAGQDVSLRRTAKIDIGAGSFALSGQDVSLKHGYHLDSETGTFTLTGQDVTLTYTPAAGSYSLACGAGAFTLSGQDIAFLRGRIMPAAVGTFTLSGQAVTLARGYHLDCGAGTFSLAGQDVALRSGKRLPCAAGSFALTGQAVVLKRGYTLAAGAGSFALTGQVVALKAGRLCAAGAGAFVLTGQDVALRYSGAATAYSLACEAGAFVLTGQAVTLSKTAAKAASTGGGGKLKPRWRESPVPTLAIIGSRGISAQPLQISQGIGAVTPAQVRIGGAGDSIQPRQESMGRASIDYELQNERELIELLILDAA